MVWFHILRPAHKPLEELGSSLFTCSWWRLRETTTTSRFRTHTFASACSALLPQTAPTLEPLLDCCILRVTAVTPNLCHQASATLELKFLHDSLAAAFYNRCIKPIQSPQNFIVLRYLVIITLHYTTPTLRQDEAKSYGIHNGLVKWFLGRCENLPSICLSNNDHPFCFITSSNAPIPPNGISIT